MLHLMPTFDITSVNEDVSKQLSLESTFEEICAANASVPANVCSQNGTKTLREVLAEQDPTTGKTQEIMGYIRSLDAFNWGYDPFHYTAPEGSYASSPQGTARIIEFRQMVMALTQLGLRTALDVVYNHTSASGVSNQSVLDKLVPGYYHRLNTESGFVEKSTCCDNTATEHNMMERLMIDSLVTWSQAFKIGAFRFDLMGHHMKRNMEAAKVALEAVDPQVYLYGEGWDFGEVQGGTRGPNATQRVMKGTGIGTFNDRLRDAVRGGGPFDSVNDLRINQGFINGLFYDPNDIALAPEIAKEKLLEAADQIRIGMAGNLTSFRIMDKGGSSTSGDFVPYGGAPTGYTDSPTEVINYVSKHDNQTLFDNNAYKAPTGTSMEDRVRMQNLGMDIVLTGQGIPFLHLGVDMLRSKSMERDSYDSGDWYNYLDFTYQSNNWNVGLPRQDKDGGNWDVIKGILSDTSISPQSSHIMSSVTHLKEMLTIRNSSPLFRLGTKDAVNKRVDFHNVGPNQIPGLLLMTISDGTCAGADLDPNTDAIVVVINATNQEQPFNWIDIPNLSLHPVLANSADMTARTSRYDISAGFRVPARTTAVFVQAQNGAQGTGLPCNSR